MHSNKFVKLILSKEIGENKIINFLIFFVFAPILLYNIFKEEIDNEIVSYLDSNFPFINSIYLVIVIIIIFILFTINYRYNRVKVINRLED